MAAFRLLFAAACLVAGSGLVAGPVLKLTSDLDPSPGPRTSYAGSSTPVVGPEAVVEVPAGVSLDVATMEEALAHSLDLSELTEVEPEPVEEEPIADVPPWGGRDILMGSSDEDEAEVEPLKRKEVAPLVRTKVIEEFGPDMQLRGFDLLIRFRDDDNRRGSRRRAAVEDGVVTEEGLASPDFPLAFEPGSSLPSGFQATSSKTITFSAFAPGPSPLVVPIPEPATLLLVGVGMVAAGLIRRRRR